MDILDIYVTPWSFADGVYLGRTPHGEERAVRPLGHIPRSRTTVRSRLESPERISESGFQTATNKVRCLW